MKKEFIDYSSLVDNAMHLIVRKSLEIFANNHFNTDHHFFISFVTKYPGVTISDKLRVKYPYEMTIVLQYQFEDLEVQEDSFSVVLTFDGQKEKVVVPFASLTAFADPSVKFGLQFRHVEEDSVDDEVGKISFATTTTKNKEKKKDSSKELVEDVKSNVIKLDFKNKKLQ